MRKFLYAVFAGLLLISATPVFADGNENDLNAVSVDSSFTPGGNPEQITEDDSIEQSDTHNSILQYSLSVPDGFDLLEAGDATLYVFNSDTSVVTKMVLPEKEGYQATGYFPAGDNYLISGMTFSNENIQSPFTMPDSVFALSPDKPFTFTSTPADDSIAKSIEVQKNVASMQQEVKADKDRLIAEGVISGSGRNLSIHQDTVSSSDFDYQPVEETKKNTEEHKNPILSVRQTAVIMTVLGIVVVGAILLLRKRSKKQS